MKKIYKISCVFIGIFLVLAIVIKLQNPYNRIVRYVNHNIDALTAYCDATQDSKNGKIEITGVKVEGLQKGEHDTIQFFYKGAGIAPASVYYGFYYSEDDVPVPYNNDNFPLIQESDNQWSWKGTGDNGGIIKKIRNNWYYYKAWF